jgi:hypothetical protein
MPELPEVGPDDEIWYDAASKTYVVNSTDVDTAEAMFELHRQHPEVAAMVRWSSQTATPARAGSLWQRDRYVTPANIYDQFRTAYDAAHADDVVSGALEIAENLAFGRLDVEADDPDEADIFNQAFEQMDLTSALKEIWREISITSNCTVAAMWGRKQLKVRGRSFSTGTKRKKTYNVVVPVSLRVIDPLKVVPVGETLFGSDKLAYIAEPGEAANFDRVLAGDNTTDLTVLEIIQERYRPTVKEQSWLANMGVDYNHLFLLNPERVWRITATKAAYERFAPVRLKSIFDILDLKQQLKEMDRSYLIGSTNFIILIKKGSEKDPAKPAEMAALRTQVAGGSRMPVIIGDHRLSIEIIAPKLDVTLKPERYNALDARITARILGILELGAYQAGAKSDDSIKLAKIVSRGLEARRAHLIDVIERKLIQPTVERNSELVSELVKLQFHPRRIALDLDPALINLLQQLRDRGDLSRESILDEVGYEQADEAKKRQREAETFDQLFGPVNVPYSSPNMGQPGTNVQDQRNAGRVGGGNNNGGGLNPSSNTPNQTEPRQQRSPNQNAPQPEED